MEDLDGAVSKTSCFRNRHGHSPVSSLLAIYLFSPIALLLELSIRPEGIMAFLAFLQLFCIASYCKFRWHDTEPVASLLFGALAMLLAYALFVLKPNWLLAVPATTLPIFVGLFGQGIPLTFGSSPRFWAFS